MLGTLTHTPAYILRSRLISDGKASDPDLNRTWPVYVDGEPTTPDNMISIKDTSPVDKGYNQYLKEVQEHYGVQVLVRAKDIPVGFLKFNSLVVGIEKYIGNTVTIGAVSYEFSSYVTSHVFLNRRPQISRLPLWTINAMLVIRQN
jgi:hypothetical protein